MFSIPFFFMNLPQLFLYVIYTSAHEIRRFCFLQRMQYTTFYLALPLQYPQSVPNLSFDISRYKTILQKNYFTFKLMVAPRLSTPL